MVKDANSVVEDLIPIFLEANMEQLNTLMNTTENVILINHKEIIKFLENKEVNETTIMELKKCLKML